MRHTTVNMKSLFSTALLAGLVSFAGPSGARAQIEWNWSFSTEAGTFTTDGNLVGGLAPAATYNIADFAVTSSSLGVAGSLSGGEYSDFQPAQGFLWDGAAVTQFFRANGAFTNGSNYALTSNTDLRWHFQPPGIAESFILDDTDGSNPVTGLLSLLPVPEPSSLALAGLGMACAVACRRRRRSASLRGDPTSKSETERCLRSRMNRS